MENKIKISEKDYNYLCELLKKEKASKNVAAESVAYLGSEIKRAERVNGNTDSFDFVTMNSTIEFTDIETGKKMKIQLVDPKKANIREGRISIFSMLGSALLGYKYGSEINYLAPAGERKIKIEKITYTEKDL
uniref:GreA/GreB family elongation factor n=1 Tax=uncultured Draconibacterium sp. TaxID=1573823 RepID=UPI0032177F23